MPSKLTADELFDLLTDRYEAAELVDVLGITNEDLKDVGLVGFIEDDIDHFMQVVSQLGLVE